VSNIKILDISGKNGRKKNKIKIMEGKKERKK